MALLPLLLLSLAAAAPAPQRTDCAALRGSTGEITIDRATEIVPAADGWVPEGSGGTYAAVPVRAPICRVEGRIEGSIGFELWLPADWNGRILGAGVGGDAGVFNYRDMALRVAQGFATVTTDSGHKASEGRWMRREKARVDYTHRAVHLTAGAAKALVARYYGQPASRSYFLGCSGGGRQALKEMQNYPGDYDGVVAGAPGPYMPLQSVRMMWFGLEQQRRPTGALTEEDWALWERRTIDACDRRDGVTDRIVENPASCPIRPAALLCRPGQRDGCLSAPKVAMLDMIVAPMRDEQGKALDRGLFPGVRTRPGPPSPLLRAMWADAVYDDAEWDPLTFRRTADLASANRIMPELRADRTDIVDFVRAGHKAILYQGWQDPSTNAAPTIQYYARLAAAAGSLARLQQSVRLFMVPGMYHCRGGPGADSFGGSGHAPLPDQPGSDVLWSLIRWVEEGRAPERIVASKVTGEGTRFTRALCPFPLLARYRGGPKDSAASFACATDATLAGMMRWQ